MSGATNILIQFKRKWQLLNWLEVFLYAFGIAFLVYFLLVNVLIAMVVFLSVGTIISFLIKPWSSNLNRVTTYIDKKLDIAEYSTGLLLKRKDTLSGLAQLQQHKVLETLKKNLNTIKPPNNVLKASLVMLAFVLVGLAVYQFNLVEYVKGTSPKRPASESIAFVPIDSTETNFKPPNITDQLVKVRYPRYTNIGVFKNTNMNVKALEGSSLSWELRFDMNIKDVSIESMGKSYPMQLDEGIYKKSFVVQASGFYNFKFTDLKDNEYTSKLYSIEMLKDEQPNIKIRDIEQFTSFDFDEDMKLSFRTDITDDYGLADAYIIATVSKGSGESVKFREEKLNFDNPISIGNKRQTVSKTMQLESLKMEPGDELYFYVEALDRKKPKSNQARSETYFAAIKDTVSDQFAVEATMGVDLMPEYFRSQRQLIIDTEKLIKNKPKLTTKDFKFSSNELGFDQKSLRLKYAEFMGEETDFGESIESQEETPDHEAEHSEEDPLAEYTHDHDNENEHNLVEEKDKDKKNNPLEEFIHDHSDPEEATLFTESLKSKLRQALNEMWDAELYLRLYTPEKSLPYQYRALKLIQEIKNSARIYVHRIGFDPPPIKEDKRLSGKLDEVSNFRKNEDLKIPEVYPSIRRTIDRLAQLISENKMPTTEDRVLFKNAGSELAAKAIENPGNYLKTLQQLKLISDTNQSTQVLLRSVQRGLYAAVPSKKPNPSKKFVGQSEINELLINELNIND
ncbi:ABC transporter permease [Spongiivirga citrea]|uniref:Tryptophan-rich sensory protein n=1 Tax=Spongiivirga citrea TaxID=1481457 RepID=A0A6M0CDT0_9FLAO|nr:ABC transporter permease [Spongiivirga citrea]NER15881.1 tryptophan-rich sensory protein [Spongiivirga citrea]